MLMGFYVCVHLHSAIHEVNPGSPGGKWTMMYVSIATLPNMRDSVSSRGICRNLKKYAGLVEAGGILYSGAPGAALDGKGLKCMCSFAFSRIRGIRGQQVDVQKPGEIHGYEIWW